MYEVPDVAAQIFQFLPQGIAYGLSVPNDQVVMQELLPYDTTATLGYVTCLAMAYVPSDQVNPLQLDIYTPSSQLYHNPNASVSTLMGVINPAIGIIPGSLNGQTPGSPTGSPSSPTGTMNQAGAPLGSGSDNSSSVKGTSAAIGVGVVAGAAVYGAAMFLIAKRYKKTRSLHRRSPSLIDTGSMMQSPGESMAGASAALMSGGRGEGVRSTSPSNWFYRDSRGSGNSGGSSGRQQISAPVMAENSLGWN